ncbi:MAG: YdeI/OmpD-associated family protein [Paracoccaceae bacterium]
MAEPPIVPVASRAALRTWLADNHARSGTVWLALWKKPFPNHIPYPEIVEELLCWGWVDSLPRSLDDTQSLLRASPRNPKSAWSAVNKAHVARARASGAMTPAGEAKVAIAIANGQWDALAEVEALVTPDDLTAALAASGGTATWDAYPRSVKRGTLEQIAAAKTPPTREKRIHEVAVSAAAGLRPAAFRRAKS